MRETPIRWFSSEWLFKCKTTQIQLTPFSNPFVSFTIGKKDSIEQTNIHESINITENKAKCKMLFVHHNDAAFSNTGKI